MLTLSDRALDRNCQRMCRRDFLRIGGLALAGVTLPELFALRAAQAAAGGVVNDKSVVLLFLQGGPSHIELFDPKMTAPSEIRSVTGEVPTKIPGITFGGTFPQLAQMTDKIAIVRSYASGNGDHSYERVTTGGNPLKAAMGSIYSRVAGTNDLRSGLPSNVVVLPEAVDERLKLDNNFETGALPTLTQPGEFGPAYGAFNPSGGGELRQNMELRMAPSRLDDRRNLLTSLDRFKRYVDVTGLLDGADRFQQQAFDVVMRGAAEAFDLSHEDPRTIQRYDTSGIFRQEDLQRYYDMRRVTNLLGRQMLLARRLCEAGCGFVTVSDCGWDMHANSNSPRHMTGMWPMGRQVDHAVSAFIQDVHERGLSDKILLIVTGEMGRSPRLNNDGGRDHYGDLTSLLVAGGGLKMGQVIGQSDRQAAKPLTERYTPQHLLGTVMHTLFDVGKLRLQTNLPRELVKAVEDAKPIPQLV